jgi:hypothetical protein
MPTTASTVNAMIIHDRLLRPSRASSGRTIRIGAVSSARIADGGAISSIVPGGALCGPDGATDGICADTALICADI